MDAIFEIFKADLIPGSFEFLLIAFILGGAVSTYAADAQRPRARDLGIQPGVLSPGRWNAIIDVPMFEGDV